MIRTTSTPFDHCWLVRSDPGLLDEFALKRAWPARVLCLDWSRRSSAIHAGESVITLELNRSPMSTGSAPDNTWRTHCLTRCRPAPEVGANRCLQADRGILTATLDASSAGTAARLKYIRA